MIRKSTEIYMPGIFNPPSRLHFNAVIYLVFKRDVTGVNIVLGKSGEDELPFDVKKDIWNQFLLPFGGGKINIVGNPNVSPLKWVYDLYKNNHTEPFTIALDEKTAKDSTFSKVFSVFPNYQIEIIPSYIDEESEEMLNSARNNDFVEFSSLLPIELPLTSRRLIFDLVKNNLPHQETDLPDNDEIDPVGNEIERQGKSLANDLVNKMK